MFFNNKRYNIVKNNNYSCNKCQNVAFTPILQSTYEVLTLLIILVCLKELISVGEKVRRRNKYTVT